MTNLINQLEQAHMKTNLPIIWPGDTVKASLKIREGDKHRIQNFEGLVIAKRNRGLGSSITIRRLSSDVYIEKIIALHAPALDKLEVTRRGKVRRAKLYYIRELSGKAARIKEKLVKKAPKSKS